MPDFGGNGIAYKQAWVVRVILRMWILALILMMVQGHPPTKRTPAEEHQIAPQPREKDDSKKIKIKKPGNIAIFDDLDELADSDNWPIALSYAGQGLMGFSLLWGLKELTWDTGWHTIPSLVKRNKTIQIQEKFQQLIDAIDSNELNQKGKDYFEARKKLIAHIDELKAFRKVTNKNQIPDDVIKRISELNHLGDLHDYLSEESIQEKLKKGNGPKWLREYNQLKQSEIEAFKEFNNEFNRHRDKIYELTDWARAKSKGRFEVPEISKATKVTYEIMPHQTGKTNAVQLNIAGALTETNPRDVAPKLQTHFKHTCESILNIAGTERNRFTNIAKRYGIYFPLSIVGIGATGFGLYSLGDHLIHKKYNASIKELEKEDKKKEVQEPIQKAIPSTISLDDQLKALFEKDPRATDIYNALLGSLLDKEIGLNKMSDWLKANSLMDKELKKTIEDKLKNFLTNQDDIQGQIIRLSMTDAMNELKIADPKAMLELLHSNKIYTNEEKELRERLLVIFFRRLPTNLWFKTDPMKKLDIPEKLIKDPVESTMEKLVQIRKGPNKP